MVASISLSDELWFDMVLLGRDGGRIKLASAESLLFEKSMAWLCILTGEGKGGGTDPVGVVGVVEPFP